MAKDKHLIASSSKSRFSKLCITIVISRLINIKTIDKTLIILL